jgi:hypothetical protein
MHVNTLSEAAMQGSLDRRCAAGLPAALALGAIALTLLFTPGVSIAAVAPAGASAAPTWPAHPQAIRATTVAAPPTWPAHPQAIRATTVAAPPTWPAHPQAIQPTTSATATAGDGFDWGSAVIGAGFGGLLTVICGAAVLTPASRRARRARAA